MPTHNKRKSSEKRRRGYILTSEGVRKLKEARKKLEEKENFGRIISKEKLAYKARISEDSIGNILGGEKRVDKNTIISFSNAVETTLIEGTDYIRPEPAIVSQRYLLKDAPRNNLPPSENPLIGREAELLKLLKFLSLDYRMPVIIVDGVGGVGKTALVIEAAYQCLESSVLGCSQYPAPQFESIIFTSAKEDRLEPRGIREIKRSQGTLREIFHAIARTLDDQRIIHASLEDQQEHVYNALQKQTTLLIVDNLETIEDKDEVLDFLADLPSTTKAVVTTREKVVLNGCIRLESLPKDESFQLLMQQAEQKDVQLDEEQATEIYDRFGGIPVALIYIVGQLASGYSFGSIVDPSNPLPKNITKFCFERLIEPIREQPAHKLLMALSLFRKSPSTITIAEVAGLTKYPDDMEEGMAKLRQMSLVCHNKDRYRALPLTREFALSELAEYPDFESSARERWVQWYVDFSQKYGGRDWNDWGNRFDRIDYEWRNFIAVLEWCDQHNRYETLTQLWANLNCFSSLRGYWGERCFWLDILIVRAKQRGEWQDATNAMSEKSYTLILMGHVHEARKQLKEAWNICPSNDFLHKTFLAQHMSVLAVQEQRYIDASKWLDKAMTFLSKANFEKAHGERRSISLQCLRAEIAYKKEEYEKSRELYKKASKQAQKIRWGRKVNSAHHGLSNILIEEGNFEEAEDFLRKGLAKSEANNHKRLIAYYRSSWARLEYHRNNKVEACKWTEKALDSFKMLNMQQDEGELKKLHTLYCHELK